MKEADQFEQLYIFNNKRNKQKTRLKYEITLQYLPCKPWLKILLRLALYHTENINSLEESSNFQI